MTVKVIQGEAAVDAEKPPIVTGQAAPEETERPRFAGTTEQVMTAPVRKRRANGTFGDIIFVQLILSALLAGGIWSGLTFGSDEVRGICEKIIALFA